MSIDPVMRDLSRHLERLDLEEEIENYIVDHEGEHPCRGCEERCRSCKIYKMGLQERRMYL